MPFISVVIPAHNAERFLAATLDSLLDQSHQDWECIVVDDVSQDATFAIAESYAGTDERIQALRVDHGGVSKARNRGFRASNDRADYCTFMDSDDIWVPDALVGLLERAQADPGAIGAHGLADFADEEGQVIEPGVFSDMGLHRLGLVGRKIQEVPVTSPTDFSVLVAGRPVFPPGLLLIERQAYLVAGPFDERLTIGEDWEMLVRIGRHGYLAFLPRVVLYYRRHDNNQSAKSTTRDLVNLTYAQAWHSPLNSPEQQAMFRRGWRARQRQRMATNWSEARALGVESPAASAKHLARAALAGWRLVRGSPRPVIHREMLTW